MKDLEKVNIDLEITKICDMSEKGFKTLCKEIVRNKAFEYLIQKHIKSNWKQLTIYKGLKSASYLNKDNFGISVKEKKYIFRGWMNDINVKEN